MDAQGVNDVGKIDWTQRDIEIMKDEIHRNGFINMPEAISAPASKLECIEYAYEHLYEYIPQEVGKWKKEEDLELLTDIIQGNSKSFKLEGRNHSQCFRRATRLGFYRLTNALGEPARWTAEETALLEETLRAGKEIPGPFLGKKTYGECALKAHFLGYDVDDQYDKNTIPSEMIQEIKNAVTDPKKGWTSTKEICERYGYPSIIGVKIMIDEGNGKIKDVDGWSANELLVIYRTLRYGAPESVRYIDKKAIPGRKPTKITMMARTMKFERLYFREWGKQEDEILEHALMTEGYDGLPGKLYPVRTLGPCKSRLEKLGLELPEKFVMNSSLNRWTKEEDDLLREIVMTSGTDGLPGALAPKRKKSGCLTRAYVLKLMDWTPEEDELLKKIVKEQGVDALPGKLYPRRSSKKHCMRRVHELGLI